MSLYFYSDIRYLEIKETLDRTTDHQKNKEKKKLDIFVAANGLRSFKHLCHEQLLQFLRFPKLILELHVSVVSSAFPGLKTLFRI